MEILTTGGAKRDENYTLPCYYMSGKGAFINQSLFDFASLIICTLLLFEGIEGIPMCALFFPLDFEGKIH